MSYLNNKIENISCCLIILLPFALITGPLLADLSISIIAIICLFYLFSKKKFEYHKSNFFIIFIFFFIYIVLNSLLNNTNFDSLKISFFYFRFGLFIIFFWYLLDQKKDLIHYLYYSLKVVLIILIVDGYTQILFERNLFNQEIIIEGRISSLFGDELILGSFIARFLPILIALYAIKEKSKLENYIIILVFIFSEALVFFSGERTAFFLINLSALYVLIFSVNLKRIRFIAIFFSAIVILSISIFHPQAKERILDKTLNQTGLLNENSEKYIFSKQHTHHYLSALKMFEKNKFFGVGVKNFRKFCDKEEYYVSVIACSTHPHNTYVQLLSEIGIIGFSFLLFMTFIFIKYTFKNLKLIIFKKKHLFNDLNVCILSVVLMTLWPIVPSGNFFNNWLTITVCYPLAILIWGLNKQKFDQFSYQKKLKKFVKKVYFLEK